MHPTTKDRYSSAISTVHPTPTCCPCAFLPPVGALAASRSASVSPSYPPKTESAHPTPTHKTIRAGRCHQGLRSARAPAHPPCRTLRVGRNPGGGLDTRSGVAAPLDTASMCAPVLSSSTWSLRCCMRSTSTSKPVSPCFGGASDSASSSAYSSPKILRFCSPPGAWVTLRDGRSAVAPLDGVGSAISACGQR